MKKRRILPLLIALILVLTMGCLMGCKKDDTEETIANTENQTEENEEDDGENVEEVADEPWAISKADWITALATSFGLDEYESTTPYFTDVNSSSEIFAYVQSCAEWGVFEATGGELLPDRKATREFVVASAVIISDILEPTGDREFPTYKEAIDKAGIEQLITDNSEEYLQAGIDSSEANSILNWAIDTYSNMLITGEETVVVSETVTDFSTVEEGITVEDNLVKMDATVEQTLAVGDVFILPAANEFETDVAKKVVSIEKNETDGSFTITTETPELTEIFDEVSISKSVSPTESGIILYEGAVFEEETIDDAAEVMTTATKGEGSRGTFSKTIKVSYSSEDGLGATLSETNRDETFGVMLADSGLTIEEQDEAMSKFKIANVGFNPTSWTMEEDDGKYKAGYTISGSVTLKNVYVDVDYDLKKIVGIPYGVKELSLAMNYEIEEKLSIEGKFEGEKKIGKMIIPIVPGVLNFEADIILYVDVNGTIGVTLENSGYAKVTYKNDKLKKTAKATASQELDVLADVEAGAGFAAELNTMGISLIDAKVKAGIKCDFNTDLEDVVSEELVDGKYFTKTQKVWNLKLDCVAPMLRFEVGNDDKALLHFEKKWLLIGDKGIVKKVSPVNVVSEKYVIYMKMEEKVVEEPTGIFAEFINSPVTSTVSFENFYQTAGVVSYAQSQNIPANTGELYLVGNLYAYYSDEPRLYIDGTKEEGVSFSFSDKTEKDAGGRATYTALDYNPTELTDITTHILYTDQKTASEIPEVGGFSDFLRKYECITVLDLVNTFGLGQDFVNAATADTATHSAELGTKGYGNVMVTLTSSKAILGTNYSKVLTFEFGEDSVSPYSRITIQEGWPANYLGEIKSLWIQAFTPAYE